MSCWVHATARDERCRKLIVEAMSSEAKKDECKLALSGEEHDFWMGTEAGMLGVYNFQGMVLGGDGTNEAVLTEVNGCIGAGGKAKLATAPNADIMWEVLCSLT